MAIMNSPGKPAGVGSGVLNNLIRSVTAARSKMIQDSVGPQYESVMRVVRALNDASPSPAGKKKKRRAARPVIGALPYAHFPIAGVRMGGRTS